MIDKYKQEEMPEEGIKHINSNLEEKFGKFGGEIKKLYITKIGEEEDKEFSYKISIVVGLTVGGKNNFIIKEKIDYAEFIITEIYGRDRLEETIVQIENPYKKKGAN